jgi:hypothetical protein
MTIFSPGRNLRSMVTQPYTMQRKKKEMSMPG